MKKRIASALLAAVMCMSMASCSGAGAPGLFPYGAREETGTQRADLSAGEEPENVKLPFTEGCYTGDGYVLEIVYTGWDTEMVYNAMLFRKDTGYCIFTGTAFDVGEDDKSLVIPSNNVEGMVINAGKRGDSMRLDVSYKGEKLAEMCGGYAFSGKSFTADADLNESFLTPGSYFSENGVFDLEISEENGVLIFDINRISDMLPVFRGRLPHPSGKEITDAVLPNTITELQLPGEKTAEPGDQKVEFEKTSADGIQCVVVADHNNRTAAEFSGRYVYAARDAINAGEYRSEGKTLTVTRVTVKGKNGDPAEYKYMLDLTVTDGEGNVLFSGSKGLRENDHTSYAVFERKSGKIIFCKGFDEDGEYITVFDFGYAAGDRITEKFGLS